MTSTILAYVPGTHVVGVSGNAMLPDWANNQLYNFKEASDATAGITQFTGYSSGDATLAKNIADIGVITAITGNNGGAEVLTAHGYVVFISSVVQNSVTIAAVKASNLKLSSQFGIAGSSSSPSSASRICAPVSMAPLSAAGADFVVATSNNALQPGEVNLLTILPNLANLRLGATDETKAIAGRGVVGSTGTAFVLGKGSSGSYAGGSTVALGLYVVSCVGIASSATLIKKGTVSPAQVDATWTHFAEPRGIAFDQTDGNPIIMVSTQDAVTNQHYFVKLSATNAAVLWACPVNADDAYGDANMGRHAIANQRLYFLGSGNTLYTINTSTGVATSQVIGTLVSTGAQISEDTNNSIVGYGQWVEGATHPTYVGTYMGALGNHTLNSPDKWFRFFPGAVANPQPAAPPFNPDGIAAVSINRAFAFTLDGHWFYVLDLGVEGTFVYDMTTEQWSHFYTSGFSAQWDVANGTMWGQRIIGGDLATTDVWEVSPTQLKDNSSLDITHVVTGGLSTRSRDFTACDVVRVAASLGLLDDTAGATFSLRLSDDNGQTFSTTYSVTLTQGNYSDEVAFRSLGSFNSPGRVFELSDVGGLIRIDGCDMNPEDEDTSATQ